MNRLQRQVIEALIYHYHDKPPRNRFQRQVIVAYRTFEKTFHDPETRTHDLKRLYELTYNRIDELRNR